ncbi:MBL fold metallo-hydrolase [Bradyrhizobium yuanmingense]|uniref:MBL fold metallo-hydrolase n=1 Tax=Bradyrhizobium yuanmingense TaxID=108015 RepID=A0A0R3BVM5_9BRAD|nr:MBL fold metallo-hydrolase [Bradyrhizobium yuanmingense]KRP89138.1 MBL fold metallo-hydrolase [Bradyrhizobium yuanmingense]
MIHAAKTYHVGEASITRIDELRLAAFKFDALYPGGEPRALERHRDSLEAGSFDAATGTFIQSIHSWLVRTPHHTILIDTATGNDKNRPEVPPLHRLNGPFLARLAAAGVTPEQVDYVLLTHVHADHVGWNTRLVDGHWVPTFPNATYVFSAIEQAYGESLATGTEPTGAARPAPALGPALRKPADRVYDDSVRPVIEAGLARLIAVDGSEAIEGISFVPTPGHSVDHASIRLVSRGEEALFAGDVMHHPLQVYEPSLNSCFCEFPEAALRSRAFVLEDAAERGSTIFTTHFAQSSVGRVSRTGGRFTWQFV